MSAFLKSLSQPEYVHVLLNHLPLTGLCAALLCLVAGVILGTRPVLFVGLALVTLFCLAVWPVTAYGQQAHDRVFAMSDDEGQAYLARHRDLAEKWVFLFYVTAGTGAVVMAAGWKWPKSLRAASLGVALLALSSLAAGAIIADCGGMVRHREFRHSPPSGRKNISARPTMPTAASNSAIASRCWDEDQCVMPVSLPVCVTSTQRE